METPTVNTPAAEARANTPPAEKKRAPAGQSLHYRLVITLYRVFAITVLYLVLAGILAYAWVMGFYAVNSSWAAPVILSAADEKSLDFREKLVTSQQTIEDLKVDTKKLQSGLAEMKKHRGALLELEPELQAAIAREKTHNRTTGPELATLDQQKQADNCKTQKVLAQLKEVEANINKDLAAGLITQGRCGDATGRAEPAQGAYTDSRIAEILLTDSVLDKTTTGTNSLDVLEKQAELRSEVAQLDVADQRCGKTAAGRNPADRSATAGDSNREAESLLPECVRGKDAVLRFRSLRQPGQRGSRRCGLRLLPEYGRVPQGGHGASRYSPGEEQAIHPIFKTQIRGFLIQMNLDHAESAKSKTVFLGRKPMLF